MKNLQYINLISMGIFQQTGPFDETTRRQPAPSEGASFHAHDNLLFCVKTRLTFRISKPSALDGSMRRKAEVICGTQRLRENGSKPPRSWCSLKSRAMFSNFKDSIKPG